MRKDQLIFSVKQEIQKQSPTQDGLRAVHSQDVEFEIAKAYEAAVIEFFMNPDFKDSFDADYFSKTYEKTTKGATGFELYVDLPASPIALPGGSGIRIVRPKDSYVAINRISESEFMNLRHLEAFACSPTPFCFSDISGKRIVLQGNRPEYKLLDTITIKLLPKFNEFDDSDDINTPGGDYNLTTAVLKIMGIRPTDNTNDDDK